MLYFDIRSIESQAVPVDGELGADDPVWQEGDPRPAGTVHVTGRISPAGSGRFYFSGRLEGTVTGECRRCLTDVSTDVEDEVHLFFADAEDETTADDPDVFPIDPQAADLDMRPAIREAWLLTAPQFLECREDCQGLCPSCGADRNAGDCGCPPVTDSRWDALRSASGRGTSE